MPGWLVLTDLPDSEEARYVKYEHPAPVHSYKYNAKEHEVTGILSCSQPPLLGLIRNNALELGLTDEEGKKPEADVKTNPHTSGPASTLPPLHSHDASTVHDDEQPSPLSTLPSSQASSWSRKLSPHVLLTAMLQRRPSDAGQFEEYDVIVALT